LNDADFNVQLKHVETETSWTDQTDHGYIACLDADGTHILRRDGFQHNCKLRQGGAYDMAAVKAIVNEVSEFVAAKQKTVDTPVVEKIPSFVESSFTSEQQKATALLKIR